MVEVPGTREPERLAENLGAAGLDPAAEDLPGIEQAASRVQTPGGRHPEAMEKMTDP